MKYALERYNELVTLRLNSSSMEESLDSDSFKDCIELSRKEKDDIKRYLRRKSLNIKKEKGFELLIQQYQAEIIQLLDFVFGEKQKKPSSPIEIVLDAVLKDLEEILTHIENRYTKYFNLDEKAPATYLFVTQTDLRNRIGTLKNFCAGILPNHTLVSIVFTPLIAFTRREENVTYRQLMYVKDLVYEMEEWSQEGDVQPDLRSFIGVLLYMNFNIGAVATMIMDEIVNCVNLLPEQNLKLEKLAEYLKQCNQSQVKPGASFRPNAVALKEQLSGWIMEEAFFLETQLRLISVSRGVRDELIPDEEKVHLGISVEALALLARSAKDSKLILNQQMTGMFRILSKFVRTLNSGTPSAQSLSKKAYGGDRKTKQLLIELLHEMIKHLHRY